MNTDALLKQIMEKIQAATARVDVTEITRLSQLARRVQEISSQMMSLADEFGRIETSVQPGATSETSQVLTPTGSETLGSTPAFQGEVLVEIDWALCGVSRSKAKVSARKMSETLVQYIAELKSALGNQVLEKLTGFRVSRGPLVSKNPAHDFLNSSTNTTYAHHRIDGTDYYVLTHSSTAEKMDAIRESWRFLRLTEAALFLRRT